MRHDMRCLAHMGHGERAMGNRGSTRGRDGWCGQVLGHHGAPKHEVGDESRQEGHGGRSSDGAKRTEDTGGKRHARGERESRGKERQKGAGNSRKHSGRDGKGEGGRTDSGRCGGARREPGARRRRGSRAGRPKNGTYEGEVYKAPPFTRNTSSPWGSR